MVERAYSSLVPSTSPVLITKIIPTQIKITLRTLPKHIGVFAHWFLADIAQKVMYILGFDRK
jgi:hypothetical protein